jgi:hypothetical protein
VGMKEGCVVWAKPLKTKAPLKPPQPQPPPPAAPG